jgi:hypothetical protein
MPTRTVEYRGKEYQVSLAHSATDKLPWSLDSNEFAMTIADIKENGYDPDQPILRTADGRLVNGRRRELAALVADVEPIYHPVEMTEAEFVIHVRRVDLHRRNLTPSQVAAIAVDLADLIEHGENRFTLENKGIKEPQRCGSTTSPRPSSARPGLARPRCT